MSLLDIHLNLYITMYLPHITCSLFVSDVLGPTAFAPVKSDINGNIKVHRHASKIPSDSQVLLMFLS